MFFLRHTIAILRTGSGKSVGEVLLAMHVVVASSEGNDEPSLTHGQPLVIY